MDSLTGGASGDVRFTPESGHSEGSHGMSAYDPKQTFIGLFCLVGVDRKPGVVVPLDHPPMPTTIWAVWSRESNWSRAGALENFQLMTQGDDLEL